MTTRNAFSENAAAGATLLDGREPGWWARIDPERLDMGECELDVLGQVYGGYFEGLRHLGLDAFCVDETEDEPNPVHQLGFDVDVSEPERRAAWEELTAAWLAEIATREAGTIARRMRHGE